MKKLTQLILAILLLSSGVYAQDFKSYYAKGDSCLYKRDFQEAVFYYRKALTHKPEKLITEDKSVLIFNNLGIAYTALTEHENALKYFFLFLEKDLLKKDKYLKFDVLNSIGKCYGLLHEYDLALDFFKKAIKEGQDSASIARIYNNIADTYQANSEIEQAKTNFKKALNYIPKSKDDIALLIINLNLGDIALNENRIENAQTYILKANSIAEQIQDTLFIVISKVYLANFYIKVHSYKQAQEELEWALKYARLEKTPDYLMKAYQSYILLFESQEMYKEAFEYLNEYKTCSDSVFFLNRSAEYESLEEKYSIREQENEMEQLKNERYLTQLKVDAQEKYIWLLAILVVLVTIFLIFGGFIHYKRSKSRAELEQKNKEIIKSKKQLEDLNFQYEKLIQRIEDKEPREF